MSGALLILVAFFLTVDHGFFGEVFVLGDALILRTGRQIGVDFLDLPIHRLPQQEDHNAEDEDDDAHNLQATVDDQTHVAVHVCLSPLARRIGRPLESVPRWLTTRVRNPRSATVPAASPAERRTTCRSGRSAWRGPAGLDHGQGNSPRRAPE